MCCLYPYASAFAFPRFMTREELAQELNTNVRNILEYRKELEEVGYVIEGTTGKYGGYQLKSGTLLRGGAV